MLMSPSEVQTRCSAEGGSGGSKTLGTPLSELNSCLMEKKILSGVGVGCTKWGSLYLIVRTPDWNRDMWLDSQALLSGLVWKERRRESPQEQTWVGRGAGGRDLGEERSGVNDRQGAAVLFPGSPDAQDSPPWCAEEKAVISLGAAGLLS